MAADDARTRSWMFVCNDYIPEDDRHLQSVIEAYCSYGVYGHRTESIHGYIELKNAKTEKQILSLFTRCQVEPRSGTPTEARDSCIEGSTNIYTYGKFPKGQGKRTDLDMVRNNIKRGIRTKPSDTSQQGRRLLETLESEPEKERDWKPTVFWLYGKFPDQLMRRAIGMCEDPYTARYPLLWEGYNGQESVILDDFSAIWFSCEELMRLLGEFPYPVKTGRGKRQLLAKTIIIITYDDPTDLFPKTSVIPRRILLYRPDKIIWIGADQEVQEYPNTPIPDPLKDSRDPDKCETILLDTPPKRRPRYV